MARINKGDTLLTGLGKLQPGWMIENDGFGLLTCRAEFIRDNAITITGSILRNEPFVGDGRVFAHKFSCTYNNLGLLKTTVDYVGIDPTMPGYQSGWTIPQTSGNNGLSTEKIETHPNFFEVTVGDAEEPIAGKFDDLTQSSLIVGKGQTYMEGFNGALFETSATAGRTGKFVGFFRDDYPAFYGKTSYLSPTTVFSGIVYTDNSANVQAFKKKLGVAVLANDLQISGAPNLIPIEYGTSWSGEFGNQLLVSKVDVENFGTLWKISYEVRYSREGFPKVVYPKIV